MQVASGSFTGNGSSQSVTGLAFQPDVVIIHDDSATAGVRTSWKSSDMSSAKTASFVGAIAHFANGITSLDANGFTVGSANDVNENTKTIHWIAFKDNGNNDFAYGQYTGNGGDDRAVVSSLPFQPALVVIKADSSTARGCFKVASLSGDNTLKFENVAKFSNGIQSLDANGFTVGSDATVNSNTVVYHWFAFKEVAGQLVTGSYTTGASPSDNRSVSGIGFTPIMVWIKSDATENAALRMPTNIGDLSYASFAGTSAANIIQANEADGFQLGTNATVQKASTTFYFAAFKLPSNSSSFIFGEDQLIN